VLWLDFGVVGAAGFAVLVVQAFRVAGLLPAKSAPALLAGLVAILTIAILGIATSQIWWLTLLDCEAVAFALLVKGADRARRPDARAIRAIEPETPQEPELSQEHEKSAADSSAPPRRLNEFADS
jgi:hypothetical protein